MFGGAQAGSFPIDGTRCLAHTGAAQNAKPLGVRRHKPVLDSVVDHLYKVPGAIGATVQIALLGGTADRFAARRSRRAANAWRECRKSRVQVLYHAFFPANHHAVAAFKTPYAAARPHIYIMNFLWCEFLGATNIVGLEMRQEVGDILIYSGCRYHQPHRPGLSDLF